MVLYFTGAAQVRLGEWKSRPEWTKERIVEPKPELKMYSDLARWWPLLSPPGDYVEEAADLLPDLMSAADRPPKTLLELGSGGGSLAYHLKQHFALTLVDRAEPMLAVSRAINPECEHVQGDMTTLDLGREFDLVLIHDAIMYMTSPGTVRAAIAAAARHCRAGGGIALLPDCVKETFEAETSCGGNDGADGRGLRYLEWSWDPDPADDTFETIYTFVLRENGRTWAEVDHHQSGLFPRESWLDWLRDAGFTPSCRTDPWHRDVFIGRNHMPRRE